jgi:hypothetical protein
VARDGSEAAGRAERLGWCGGTLRTRTREPRAPPNRPDRRGSANTAPADRADEADGPGDACPWHRATKETPTSSGTLTVTDGSEPPRGGAGLSAGVPRLWVVTGRRSACGGHRARGVARGSGGCPQAGASACLRARPRRAPRPWAAMRAQARAADITRGACARLGRMPARGGAGLSAGPPTGAPGVGGDGAPVRVRWISRGWRCARLGRVPAREGVGLSVGPAAEGASGVGGDGAAVRVRWTSRGWRCARLGRVPAREGVGLSVGPAAEGASVVGGDEGPGPRGGHRARGVVRGPGGCPPGGGPRPWVVTGRRSACGGHRAGGVARGSGGRPHAGASDCRGGPGSVGPGRGRR